jgi:hypothetical protein
LKSPSEVRRRTYSRVRASQFTRVIAMRHRAVFSRLSPPRLRRWRWVLPEDAGNGVTPQRAANEASDRSRSGLSPATTRRAPATLRADAAHSQHRCGVRADEWRHDTVDGRDLGGECPVAVGEQTQGPASHRARVVEVSHAEARRVGEQLMTREPVELIVQVVRCPDHNGAHLVDGLGAGLDRGTSCHTQDSQLLDPILWA